MKNILLSSLILILGLSSCSKNSSDETYKSLKKGFQNPPLEARPRALWDWVDGNFELSEITHEMEEAKRMGLGGFDIWDVWSVVDEEHKITPGPAFMSDSSLLGICHAINEAERIEFDLGLIIASGWNAGGPWTLPENQTMGIFHSDTLIKVGSKISLKLNFPIIPGLTNDAGKNRRIFIPLNTNGKPQFYKTIAVLAIRQNNSASLSPKTDIIDLSSNFSRDEILTAELPAGYWKIDWSVCTNTGEPMIASTPNSKGPMIDHFNPEASKAHINFFIDKLEKTLGKPIGKSGLSYFYTDSYEVKGNLWTPMLPEEFMKRKGYSLIPYLPVLDGQIVEDSTISARFKFDFQQVLSDLIIESHYAKTREISEAHGVGFVAEAAGPGMPIHNCPFESLKSSGSLSFPRGEFWHIPSNSKYWTDMHKSDKSNHYLNDLQVIKGVASASHIYNQKFVEAESFTGTHLWNEGPGDLKPTLDRTFCEGLNRVIFHTWPHTPINSGKPGWVYAFGNIINENLIWWPMAKPFMDYIGRSSFLLQQGNFVGDVLFYYGDAAPNFAPPKSIKPELGFGYDYDYINTDIILRDLTFENGELCLPHGQKYKVLVLPNSQEINPLVLSKINELLKQGAIISGPKPIRSHSLQNWQANDSIVQILANDVWGDLNGQNLTSRTVVNGHLYWGKALREILLENKILPDVDFTGSATGNPLDFIHRELGNINIYFIRNTTNEAVSGALKLRATGQSIEVWNPESAEINPVLQVNSINGVSEIPVYLEAYESRFIVFSNQNPKMPYQSWDPMKYKWDVPETQKLAFSQKWTVNFPIESKGPGKVELDSIIYWNLFQQDNIRFFSGIASYENYFLLGENYKSGNQNIELSLTDLSEVAEVYVNQEYAGTIWHTPFKLDISKCAKKGKNQIQIKVANTWANRLCGDARLPVNERISNSNVVRLPNAWSYPMNKIPLEEYPLINSGIAGEIILKMYTF